MVPAGNAGWHLRVPHVSPATQPAQQQQYEQFLRFQQQLQEEEQQHR